MPVLSVAVGSVQVAVCVVDPAVTMTFIEFGHPFTEGGSVSIDDTSVELYK